MLKQTHTHTRKKYSHIHEKCLHTHEKCLHTHTHEKKKCSLTRKRETTTHIQQLYYPHFITESLFKYERPTTKQSSTLPNPNLNKNNPPFTVQQRG